VHGRRGQRGEKSRGGKEKRREMESLHRISFLRIRSSASRVERREIRRMALKGKRRRGEKKKGRTGLDVESYRRAGKKEKGGGRGEGEGRSPKLAGSSPTILLCLPAPT